MKPTMIKTKTTVGLVELADDHTGVVDIGGVPHLISWSDMLHDRDMWIEPRDGGDGGYINSDWLSPRVKVTVTDTREMTTDDLQVGDCFCLGGERVGLEFSIWTGDIHAIIGVNRADDGSFFTERMNMPSIDGETVTLVDVEFEAEPVDEERTVPVSDVNGGFELHGHWGRTASAPTNTWAFVQWNDGTHKEHKLPHQTPVKVREPAAYDSPDDVSVGDVVVHPEGFDSGIVTRIIDGHAHLITGSGHETRMLPGDLRPARLTSVTWTPREEVTR